VESFLSNRVLLHCGDCREVLAELPENHFDSCCCDPPYHLTSIVKRFGAENAAPAQFGSDGRYARVSGGFMNKAWDGGDVAFDPATWRAVWRVLKPGAHLVAFGGTRTFARMAVAIEDAGFEIRDTIAWLYGSGFPKSHDVSKGLDRTLDFDWRMVGTRPGVGNNNTTTRGIFGTEILVTETTNLFGNAWNGWGTALKPAMELLVLARKPLSEGTIAANVLKWGTGAINVDGCRIGTSKDVPASAAKDRIGQIAKGDERGRTMDTAGFDPNVGRWPANVTHDGSAEVTAAFPETISGGGVRNSAKDAGIYGAYVGDEERREFEANEGSAARFFYTSKADSDDRLGSKHPCVKPLDLMQWLVRLVTPPGGRVLDPFSGTGTAGEAAWREGFSAVLIEREEEYCADIRRRMALVLAGPDERARESVKAKNLPRDDGPLFGGKP
jgi:site-specific DNA-methyltransferase (adenine-specific)